MRSVEVKRIGLKSAMKSVLFASVIPLAILFVFLGLMMAVSGFADPAAFANTGANANTTQSNGEQPASLLMQVLVFAVPFALYPFFAALVILLLALSYNLFASKFGGLKISISDKNEGGENLRF